MNLELSRLMDALPGLVWTALPDGRAEFLNQRWCDYTGLSRDQAIGYGWQSTIHPDDLTQLLDGWRSLLESNKPGELEGRLRRYDGEYRRFLISAAPITDQAGRVVKWCGINTDIEQRLQAEAVHAREKASEAEFRRAYDSMAEAQRLSRTGSFITDLIAEDHNWSDELYRLFEIDPGTKVTVSVVRDRVHPADVALFDAAIDKSQKGADFDQVFRIVSRSGNIKYVHAVAHVVERVAGRPLFIGAIQDVTKTKLTEETLRAREVELRRAHYHLAEGQRLSQTGSFSSDPTMDEHTWSDELYRICDFEVDSQPGIQRFREIVHPEDLPSFDAVIADGLAGNDFDFLFRIVTPKGVQKHLRGVGRLVDRISGRPIFVGTIQDVTATKVAESALRARERDLRAIVEAIPAGVVLLSEKGAVEVANRPLLEYLGKTSEELVRSGSNAAVHAEDLTRTVTALEHSLATGTPYDVEQRLRRFDGTFRWFQVRGHPILDTDEKIARWYILYTDIDQRKRAEEALREAERFTRQVLDSIPGMVAVFSGAGEVEFVNRQTLDYYGATTEEIQRWQTGEMVHPDDRTWVFERFAQAMASGEAFDWESRSLRRDGVYRWIQTRGSPLRERDGRVIRWYNLLIDIDDRKRAEEALKASEIELRRAYDRLNEGQRLMTLGTFAASIAHEVNQPLSGIITNANTCLRMLSADPPNVEGARKTAQRTLRDGDRASQVIQQLRALFSRKQLDHKPVHLDEAAREVLALCSHELQRNRIVLQMDFQEHLPAVMGDRVQLQQVALNLIVNAMAAMAEVDSRPRELLVATAQEAPDRVRFLVRDSGVGVDPQNVGRLFDTFFTTKPDGMGIGLSISRSIIENHNGRLWADANEGPGATFGFSIPCNPDFRVDGV